MDIIIRHFLYLGSFQFYVINGIIVNILKAEFLHVLFLYSWDEFLDL